MKKSLVALAVLAASGASFAQATLYGTVDMGYGTLSTNTAGGATASVTGISQMNATSNIGLKGTEDLGRGMTALFDLQYSIAADDGGGLGGRKQFIGLAGGFGTVTLGNQNTLIANTNGIAQLAANNGTAWLIGGNQNTRRANMINYSSPSFGGLTVSAQIGFAEAVAANASNEAGDNTAISLTYSAGPLTAGYAMENTKLTAATYTMPGAATVANFGARATTTLSDALTDRVRTSAGVAYDLGVAKVGVQFSRMTAGSAADYGSFTGTAIAVSVPLGAVTLAGEYSVAKVVDTNAADVGLTGLNLTGRYALSKRTTAYIAYGNSKQDTAADNKESQYSLGLTHTF